MSEGLTNEQIIQELTQRLSITQKNKVQMEEAVRCAESLCVRISYDADALHTAKQIKKQCENALEDVDKQIQLLSKMIRLLQNIEK